MLRLTWFPIPPCLSGAVSRFQPIAWAAILGFTSTVAAVDKARLQAAFEESKKSKKPLLVVAGSSG